jgi:hypothetical protein
MSDDARRQPIVQLFWEQFNSEKDTLRSQIFEGSVRAAYDRIGALLALAHYPHVHEITSDDNSAILIFTPESDPSVAEIVDWFVKAAPTAMLSGWKVFNRRQRKPLKDAFLLLEHVYEVDATDAVFSIEPTLNKFDIVMYTASAVILGEPEKEGFVSFFLEHALGEEIAMGLIGHRSVMPFDPKKECHPADLFVETILNSVDDSL